MSADKLQAVHEALADVFNEPNLNAMGKETSHASFDRETLSEAFSEPRLDNTEHSFARFDHAALTGIFNEALPTSSIERLPQTNFDQAFAEILSEPPSLSSNAESSQPNFDQQALSEMLSKSPPVSTNTRPPQPSFDHQALAEMLTESRADPIDTPIARPSFETDSPSAPLAGGVDRGNPLAKPSKAASSTNMESARQPRARSLLARLHHIFATKDEALRTDSETNSLHTLLPDQTNKPEPIATDNSILAEAALPTTSLPVEISTTSFDHKPKSLQPSDESGHAAAVTASIDVASTLLRQATLLPVEKSTLFSSQPEASPSKLKSEPSIPADAGRLNSEYPDVRAAAVATSTETENALAQQATSWSVETATPKLENLKPLAPIGRKENLGRVAADRPVLDDKEHAKNPDVGEVLPPRAGTPQPTTTASRIVAVADVIVATAAAANAHNAPSQRPRSPISSEAKSAPLDVQTQPSFPTSPGRFEKIAPATSTDALTAPPSAESAPPQRFRSLSAESPPKFSANPKPTLATSHKETSPPTSPTQSMYSGLLAKTASIVPAANPARAAVLPWQTERLLNEILSPASPSTESHYFNFRDETSLLRSSGEPDRLEPPVEPVAAPPPVRADVAQQNGSIFLADLPALVSTNTITCGTVHEQNSQPTLLSDRPDDVGPSIESHGAIGGLPKHTRPLWVALDVLNTEPSPPLVEDKSSRLALAGRSDHAGISMETIAGPSDAGSALAQLPKSFMPERRPAPFSADAKSSAEIFEQGRWRWPVPGQPANEMPMAESAAVASSTDTESAAPQSQQAKSLLDELDLDTAIQLRWTMRDIRGNRTRFSPVSDNHLRALMNLGLVELRDGVPRLTALGFLALD